MEIFWPGHQSLCLAQLSENIPISMVNHGDGSIVLLDAFYKPNLENWKLLYDRWSQVQDRPRKNTKASVKWFEIKRIGTAQLKPIS